jgi:hypothetical protein
VLFASLVDDPSSLPEQFPTEADQDEERQRLFRLIEELVKWDTSNKPAILQAAHAEILKSTGGKPPAIYDPCCGDGSIPLEAQRLGPEAYGSGLNPVAVLITKALIEIPPRFAGQPPVNPVAKKKMSGKGMWTGSRGLGEDEAALRTLADRWGRSRSVGTGAKRCITRCMEFRIYFCFSGFYAPEKRRGQARTCIEFAVMCRHSLIRHKTGTTRPTNPSCFQGFIRA